MIQIETKKQYAEMSPMDIYNITDFFQTHTNKEKELLNNIANIQNIINESGIKDYQNIQWNIFKHIGLDSKYDYFKISKLQFPIIGNNKTDIIHIVLKSDISKLNFWDIMIKILLERFLIYNPKSEEDIEKFKDKKINTYVFLLDENSFIKINWDWDKGLIKDIKNELNITLEKNYQTNHNDIYKYFTHIKDKKGELWEEHPDKIIDEIVNPLIKNHNFPDYIKDFFKDINTKIDEEEDYDYVNEYETFNKKLNKKLQLYLKKYFFY